MLDEVSPELIIIAGGGAFLVLGLMVVVWFLSTKEDVEQTSTHEVLGAAQTISKGGGKKRKQYSPRRKKETQRDNFSTDEEDERPRKSILKASDHESGINKLHVEFKMDGTPPRDQEQSTRVSPPTPHPNSLRKLELSENSHQDNKTIEVRQRKSFQQSKASQHKVPSPAPKQVVASPNQSSGQRKKAKPKQPTGSFDPSSLELPASKISEILTASVLTDADVELLMEKLLEKQEANQEWDTAHKGSGESIKSLKKLNDELQNRCQEAEKTVNSHVSRIKELRSEIVQEKARRTSSETTFQAKIIRQNEEINMLKGKLDHSKTELSQMKATESASANVQQEHQNTLLKNKNAALAAENEAQLQQIAQLQNSNSDLQSELCRFKEVLKDSHNAATETDEAVMKNKQLGFDLKAKNEELSRANCEIRELQADVQQRKEIELQQQQTESLHVMEIRKLNDELSALKFTQNEEREKNKKDLLLLEKELRLSSEKNELLQTEKSDLVRQIELRDSKLLEEKSLREELKKESQVQASVLSNGTANADNAVELGTLNDLKEENQELKEQVTAMQKKLDELKTKNSDLRDNIWKARDNLASSTQKQEQELKQLHIENKKEVSQAKEEGAASAIQKQLILQKELLHRLFPDVVFDDPGEECWLEVVEQKLKEELNKKDKELNAIKMKEEQFYQDAQSLRETLLSTKEKLDLLQSKCQVREEQLKGELAEAKENLNDKHEKLKKEEMKTSEKLKEFQEKESENVRLTEENKQLNATVSDLNTKLSTVEEQNLALKQANFDLNTRLESLNPVISTSSDV